MMPLFGCCIRKIEDVKVLDFRHCGLSQVPNAVFNAERTIESLHVDSNQIKVLPRELFHCHGLRQLTLSDNDITVIPSAVSSLTNIEKLDISKNGVSELPDNIKSLKLLNCLDASINPLGRLPDGFTQLLNLSQLCLNDCFLEYLPGNLGRLSQLKILELRENHLKTLPQSLSRLSLLERLDIGCNEFTELPGSVIATLSSLLEFWCDSNQITGIPKEIGNLKQLMYLDVCKNRITSLPDEIDGCISLSDIHLSTNLLHFLPESIGRLSNLTTLKVNDNQLLSIPSSIGGLVSLSELDISANDLEEMPPTIGLLRHLRTLIADENFLSDIPCELGSCSGLTVLSVRSNKLTYLPDEIGRIPRLRVLNLSDNEIKVLPYSLMNLKELQALWLAENQSKALIRLQATIDQETQRKCLTCYLLPQQRMDPHDKYGDDNQSFHPSLWEEVRQQRQQIQFKDTNKPIKLQDETTSAYPKEMRVMTRHVQNEAIRKNTITDSVDDSNDADAVYAGNGTAGQKTASHRLVKLEKEKAARDKARINHVPVDDVIKPDDVNVTISKQEKSPKTPEKSGHNFHNRQHRHSNQLHKDTPNGQAEPEKILMNGSYSNQRVANENSINAGHMPELRTIQSGHYHVSSNSGRNDPNRMANSPANNRVNRHSYHVERQPSLKDQSYQAHLERNSSLKDQSYDRYISNKIRPDQYETSKNINSVRQDMKDPTLHVSPKSNSQVVINQEETFGVFVSDEDPKVYQRRFKYYQRMRKHRKNPEVQSDLGYYGCNYKGSVGKAASEMGHRMRRPLQQGRDGFDKWEWYSQRSMGDGYASDLEGRKNQPKYNLLENTPSRRSLVDSRTSLGEKRPPVPPSYNLAMAKRSEIKNVENTPFPPPPPYKPPARDAGPDGASNDGAPRLSPTNENHTDGQDLPFKTYSDAEKTPEIYNSFNNFGAVATVNNSIPVELSSSRYYVTSTPKSPTASRRSGANHGSISRSLSAHTNLTNQKQDSASFSNYSAVENLNRKSLPPQETTPIYDENKRPKSLDYRQRSSFYGSSPQQPDVNADLDYAAQISKSLGRLGYSRESDRKLARPPDQFNNDIVDMVPPPALFSGKDPVNINDSPGNHYASNPRSLSGPHRIYEPLPEKTKIYTPSSRGRSSNEHSATSNYSYLPPPSRKSPKLPHKQIIPSGLEIEPLPNETSNSSRMTITVIKNPGLGFSVAGGIGLQGNPYRPLDEGIFVTKVTTNGPASNLLLPGDKILTVNEHNLTHMEHNEAVNILKNSPAEVFMTIERMLPTDV